MSNPSAPAGGSIEVVAAAVAEDALPSLPAGTTHAQLFAALQASAARTPPSARLLATFAGDDDAQLVDPAARNAARLVCVRAQCGSVILLPGKAELVRAGEAEAVGVRAALARRVCGG
jgi:hypothetical protein